MVEITFGLSLAAIVLSGVSLVIGIMAFVELRSFMKSTHKIEYVSPLDQKFFEEINQKDKQQLEKAETTSADSEINRNFRHHLKQMERDLI